MANDNHVSSDEERIRELELKISQLQAEQEDVRAMLQKEQEQKQFYQLVADFTFGWELWFDASGKINYCSPSCRDITGYTANQVVDAPSVSGLLVYNSDREKFDRFLSDSIHQLLVSSALEFRIVTRTRQIRWCALNLRGVYDVQGRYLGIRASVHDITKLKGALGHISGLSAGRELEGRNRQRLKSELESKERELVAILIQLSRNNEHMARIKKQLRTFLEEPAKDLYVKVEHLLQQLEGEPEPAVDNELVEVQIEKLHPGFMDRLLIKHPKLSAREKRLCACLRLGLTSKEVAGLNNQAPQSVEIARVRLRKKMKLPREMRLANYLMEI
ncbi:MAG: PAS domain S-box protein [Mariniphaga sp.]